MPKPSIQTPAQILAARSYSLGLILPPGLTPCERALVALLYEARPAVVPYVAIEDELGWSRESINEHSWSLRRKLNAAKRTPGLVCVKHGVGLRWEVMPDAP